MARAAARSRSRRKTSVVRLDMSGVEARVTVPEDEYLVTVHEVEEREGDKAPYFAWQFKIAEGEYEGQTLYNNTSLSEQALWNLKTLLEALGVEIPDEAFDLDLEEMKGLELMVSVEHDKFEGKKQAKIVDFWPAEEKKPASRGGRRSARDKDESKPRRGSSRTRGREEPAARRKTVSQDEINDMDEDELQSVIDDFDLDVDLKKFKTLTKMKASVIDAAEAAEVLADE